MNGARTAEGNAQVTTDDSAAVFDLSFWLMFIAAVPAGVGGALLGAKAVDWTREQLLPRTDR